VYLSSASASRNAVVLAASRGAGLEAVTADKPKVMLPIAGKPLLRRLVEAFKKEGINDITVVGGYRADAIDTSGIRLVVNEKHAQTGELASLACAAKSFTADTVISYGDLLFRSYILRDLVESDSDFCVVVDSSQMPAAGVASTDFAYCSTVDDRALFGQQVWLDSVTSSVGPANSKTPQGRWMGLLNVRGAGRERLVAMLEKLQQRDDFDKLDMAALLNALVAADEKIEVQYVHGHWRGVNDLDELRQAGDFAHGQAPYGSNGSGSSEAGA
jgi:phosphoenolpyruvate phosphomutase